MLDVWVCVLRQFYSPVQQSSSTHSLVRFWSRTNVNNMRTTRREFIKSPPERANSHNHNLCQKGSMIKRQLSVAELLQIAFTYCNLFSIFQPVTLPPFLSHASLNGSPSIPPSYLPYIPLTLSIPSSLLSSLPRSLSLIPYLLSSLPLSCLPPSLPIPFLLRILHSPSLLPSFPLYLSILPDNTTPYHHSSDCR